MIVLAAVGETHLLKVADSLAAAELTFVLIREPDAPYHGAATAIGVLPIAKTQVQPVLKHLKLLKRSTHGS